MAAGRIPGDKLAAVKARLEDVMRQRGRGESTWTADNEVHELVAAYCGNKSMAAMIADAPRARLCNVERLSQRAVQARAEHLAIVQALQAGDAERARATMTAHLGAVRAFARTLGYLPHED